jgi:predicted N-formylglutamate amidohydrolase
LIKLILTCEHGGNNIPAQYKNLFKQHQRILNTHRGYDPGALVLAKHLQMECNANLFYSEISRLLIELNRSLHHPDLFSSITKDLSTSEKKSIINTFYNPYRNQVENFISNLIKQNQKVIHISVHSFTPILNNIKRNCEIGLLYDPSRKNEKEFCKQWKAKMRELQPEYIIRFNYPYKGVADGFTTFLRKIFPENYIGIELEVNQKLFLKNQAPINIMISKSLISVLKDIP